MKNAQKGFTLIEIMIVVAIIAILAAIAIPNFIAYRKTAAKNACVANCKSIETAAEAYMIQNPKFDQTTIQIKASEGAPGLYNDQGTGFLKAEPVCPMNGEYTCSQDESTKAWKAVCSYTDTSDDTYSHPKGNATETEEE